MVLSEHSLGFHRVRRGLHREPGTLQRRHDHLADRALVLDDQYPRAQCISSRLLQPIIAVQRSNVAPR